MRKRSFFADKLAHMKFAFFTCDVVDVPEQVVEMATLLYLGEFVHARHLWRRWKDNNPSTLLADWWKVGAGMMSNDPKAIWEGLAHVEATHPAPIKSYAQEVGSAFRKNILVFYSAVQPYLDLLNFSSAEEAERFLKQATAARIWSNNSAQRKTALTQVVAFLDSAAYTDAKA